MAYRTETIYGKPNHDPMAEASGGLISMSYRGHWQVTCRGSKAKCEASAKSDRAWGHAARVVKDE